MRLRFLCVVAALLLPAAGCSNPVSVTNPPVGPQAACSTLVLTGHPDYPPVAWAAGSTLDGGGIEVVRRLARDNHVALRVINERSWSNAQLAVQDGKADAI